MKKNYNHRNLPASDGWRFNVSLHRHLGRLCALLLTLLAVNATAWADNTLFTADFTNMGTYETSYFSTNTTPAEITIDGKVVKFMCNATDKGNYSINSTNGLTFPNNNMGNKYFVAIPVSNINGSITVTFSHTYSSAKANYNALFIAGDYVSNPLTNRPATNVKDLSNQDTSCSATFETTETSGYLYFGRASSNFPKLTGVTITTPDGQVTPTPVTPTLSATDLNLTVGSTGKSTITATANGSAVNNLTYSYLSSDTGVATVVSDGTVTAHAVGTATITVNSAAVPNTYNEASTTFTVNVRKASTPSGESTRWDFTTTTEEEALSLFYTGNFTNNTSGQYIQSVKDKFTKNKWETLTDASGNEPNVLKGLKFLCENNWGTGMLIYYGGTKRIQFNGAKFAVQIPALVAGDKVRVTWCTSNTNTVVITPTNMHTDGTTTSSNSSTQVTTEFIVNSDGDASFSFNNNAQLFKIEVEGDERIALNTFRPMGGQSGLATVNYNEFGSNSSLDISHYAILAYANANDDPHVAFQNSDFEVISSSDESVVPLSGISLDGYGTNGRLMVNYRVLKKEGESTITVRFKGNTTYKPAVCEFTVTVIDTRTAISISSVPYTMWTSSTYQPVIAIVDANGNQLNASQLSLTYSSSNTNVSISNTSPLTLASGTGDNKNSTITVSFAGNDTYKPADGTFKITVRSKMPVTIDAATMYLVNDGNDTKLATDYITLKDDNGNTVPNNTGTFTMSWADPDADHKGVTLNGLYVKAGTTKGKTKVSFTFSGNDQYAQAYGSMIVEVVGVVAPVIAYNESSHEVTITQSQGKQVKYTTDGSDPRTSTTAQTATPVNFTVDGTCTIYAVAIAGNEMSTVTEKNILFPGTYQYTLQNDEAEQPAPGLAVPMKDASDNTIIRMTFGALPEFYQKNGSNLWRNRSRDGDMQDAEFEGYRNTTIAESYDGTSEDRYNSSNGYGAQFYSSPQNTPFSLPIAGAYVKFEPEVDGKLQVVIRQNGAFTYKNGAPDGTMRKRVVYFADETGRAFVPETEYTAQMNLNSVIDDQLFTYYDSDSKFTKNSDKDGWDLRDNFPYYKELLGLSRNASYDVWTAMAGSSVPNKMVKATDNYGYGTGEGYLVVSKAYVKYTINVKAGKTYFLTGNLTKVGLCGYQFTPDATYAGRKNAAAELREGESGGSAVNTTLLNTGNVNKPMDVKVYRKFEADTWATLVLPFSVSASKVREVFGDGTLILNFADVTNEVNENGKPIINLHLRKHYHQMIVAGMPLLIRPARTVENATFSNVTLEKLNVTPMSQDIHATANNFREGYKLNGSYEPTVMPAYAYYLVDDEFKQKTTGKTTNSKGMRAWIDGASGPFQAKVNYVNLFTDFADEDMGIATEVEQIAEALGLQPVVTGAIYNLNGQKVSADGNRDGLPAGVYVQNGKKFVVR